MSIQDHIIALLHGDLKNEPQVTELLQQLAASPESRQLLLEHIELGRRVDHFVESIPSVSVAGTGLWERIDAFERNIGNAGSPAVEPRTRTKTFGWLVAGAVVLALLAGFGSGYWIANDEPETTGAVPQRNIEGMQSPPVMHKDHGALNDQSSNVDMGPLRASEPKQPIRYEHDVMTASPASSTANTPDAATKISQTDLEVLSPNGGERFIPGSVIPLMWSQSQENARPAVLEYSVDGGDSWMEIDVAEKGRRKLWQIPESLRPSSKCLVRVGVEEDLELEPQNEQTFIGHDSGAAVAELSPDGRLMMTVGSDTKVLLWDLHTGQLVRSMAGHTGFVTFGKFNRDGTKFASCSQDGSVRVWDVATGKQEYVFMAEGGQKKVTWAVAFSPDGETVAVTNDDGSITLWDLRTGMVKMPIDTLKPHNEGIRYIEYTADGTRLLTSSSDMTVAIVDVRTGEVLHRFIHHEDGPLAENPTREQITEFLRLRIVNGVQLTPDGKVLISCGYDGLVKFWDVESGDLIRSEQYHGGAKVSSITLSPDGTSLSSVGYDGTTKIVDVATGNVVATIADGLEGKIASMTRSSFSADRRFLAIAHQDGRATLWRLKPLKYTDLSDSFFSIDPCKAAESPTME